MATASLPLGTRAARYGEVQDPNLAVASCCTPMCRSDDDRFIVGGVHQRIYDKRV
jgi:hypothetical protein